MFRIPVLAVYDVLASCSWIIDVAPQCQGSLLQDAVANDGSRT